jgi:hypothetical protein
MVNHILHLLPDWPDALLQLCRVTRRSVVSVIERTDSTPNIEGEYYDAISAARVDASRPGIPERDLPDRIRPTDTFPVGRFVEMASARSVLEQLDLRSESSQWAVPDALHRQVMTDLDHRFAEVTVSRSLTVEVATWTGWSVN